MLVFAFGRCERGTSEQLLNAKDRYLAVRKLGLEDAISSVLEFIEESDLTDIRETPRPFFEPIRDLLTERLEVAKAAGEFPSEFEPEVVAGIIGTYMQGLLRVVLVSYDRKQVERELEVFLTGFGF